MLDEVVPDDLRIRQVPSAPQTTKPMAKRSASIYDRRSGFKTGVVIMALVIGVWSLFYTNRLVQQLADRERKQIDLYAKALARLATTEEGPEQLFLIHDVLEFRRGSEEHTSENRDGLLPRQSL